MPGLFAEHYSIILMAEQVEFCNKTLYNKSDKQEELDWYSCSYNNTMFFTGGSRDYVFSTSCTTFVTSSLIILFAIYVIKNAFQLKNNRSFYLLILGLIICGTISGAYAVFLQYLFYETLANLPVLGTSQIRCIDAVLN